MQLSSQTQPEHEASGRRTQQPTRIHSMESRLVHPQFGMGVGRWGVCQVLPSAPRLENLLHLLGGHLVAEAVIL